MRWKVRMAIPFSCWSVVVAQASRANSLVNHAVVWSAVVSIAGVAAARTRCAASSDDCELTLNRGRARSVAAYGRVRRLIRICIGDRRWTTWSPTPEKRRGTRFVTHFFGGILTAFFVNPLLVQS